MPHTAHFLQVTEAIKPVNTLLQHPGFLATCVEVLSLPGVPYSVAASGRVTVPYDGAGIYLLWADFSRWDRGRYHGDELFREFLDKWDTPTENISYFPKSNRGRSKTSLGAYKPDTKVPFYLGKSEKVGSRIDQHLYLAPGKRTYALKLAHRSTLLLGIDFQINWLPLATTRDSYFLVSRVESLLRDRLNPIIGKQ